MTSINIAIKEEAYDFLKSLKDRDKSFSDVILDFRDRRKGTAKDLMKYFGIMKNLNINWKEKEKRMMAFRESFNKKIGESRKNMVIARREIET